MILKIHPKNPEPRKIAEVVAVLAKGGVAIVPTDTIYAFVCDLSQYKGFEKICSRRARSSRGPASESCAPRSKLSTYVWREPIINCQSRP